MIGTKKLGQTACRARLRGLFFTATDLISQMEKAHKQYRPRPPRVSSSTRADGHRRWSRAPLCGSRRMS